MQLILLLYTNYLAYVYVIVGKNKQKAILSFPNTLNIELLWRLVS